MGRPIGTDRACSETLGTSNHVENTKIQRVNDALTNDLYSNSIRGTFWNVLRRGKMRRPSKIYQEIVDDMALQDLVKQIFKVLGEKVYTPYDLAKYSTLVNMVSKNKTKREILSETYMCAMLMPDNEL